MVNEAERLRLAAIVRRCRGSQSQESFAHDVGVSQSAVAEWERGRIPSLENLERIALRIGLTPERLLAEVYDRPIEAIPSLLDQVKAASPTLKAQILRLLADELERGEAIGSGERLPLEPELSINVYSDLSKEPESQEPTTPRRRKTARHRAG